MQFVRAKKSLGQHFLKDENIAYAIVQSLSASKNVLEIGPGTGVLTKYLLKQEDTNFKVIELDIESVSYLKKHYSALSDNIIHGDFLHTDIESLFNEPFSIVGNFPYNISSQIMFKVLENRDQIPEVVGMFQHEVAMRLAAKPGKKDYGILSVLLQAFYDIEYLFIVQPHVFDPPPKVKSAVIRVKRNNVQALSCNEALFKTVVKTAFNQRRKMMRNALSSIGDIAFLDKSFHEKRAEQLSVEDFVTITNALSLQKENE